MSAGRGAGQVLFKWPSRPQLKHFLLSSRSGLPLLSSLGPLPRLGLQPAESCAARAEALAGGGGGRDGRAWFRSPESLCACCLRLRLSLSLWPGDSPCMSLFAPTGKRVRLAAASWVLSGRSPKQIAHRCSLMNSTSMWPLWEHHVQTIDGSFPGDATFPTRTVAP